MILDTLTYTIMVVSIMTVVTLLSFVTILMTQLSEGGEDNRDK
jgi:hypothetical protein